MSFDSSEDPRKSLLSHHTPPIKPSQDVSPRFPPFLFFPFVFVQHPYLFSQSSFESQLVAWGRAMKSQQHSHSCLLRSRRVAGRRLEATKEEDVAASVALKLPTIASEFLNLKTVFLSISIVLFLFE